MRKITYEAIYTKGNETLFSTYMFAGVNGVYTGFKSHAFSISENQRKPTSGSDLMGFMTNVAMIFTGYKDISWIIRETLTECNTFDCAYNKLSTDSVIAPGYIILAGTKDYEGVIITRNRFDAAHVDRISEDRWYLLQTNEDHFAG